MKELMEQFRRGLSLPDPEQTKAGKEVWKIAVEEVFTIGLVGQSPVVQGVRVAKNNLGNVPARLMNGASAHSPGNNLTQTYFFKGEASDPKSPLPSSPSPEHGRGGSR